MKILLIGGGGREHALAWKLAQSPRIKTIWAAPGNPGIARLAECLPIKVDDLNALVKTTIEKGVDWVIVGPEAPLCYGLADRLQAKGIKVFGPTQAAAELEGSKIFAKRFMQAHGIPTAAFEVFTAAEAARTHLKQRPLPCVIKADGLAAGKGVFVCTTEQEAEDALQKIFVLRSFGTAGNSIVIEDCLTGTEASFLVFSDGEHVLPLAAARDHKTIYENNKGPNTGGMGSYSPTPTITPALQDELLSRIVHPTLTALKNQGTPLQGVLYIGLMLTADGPQVLEYNVRLGDPEAQVILPRLTTDFADILDAAASGHFDQITLTWDPRPALCVVLASAAYPGSYKTGQIIAGLENINDPNVLIFHAGTKQAGENIVTAGGRVLGVTALAKSLESAREKAYDQVRKISWEGMYYRKDIGQDVLTCGRFDVRT